MYVLTGFFLHFSTLVLTSQLLKCIFLFLPYSMVVHFDKLILLSATDSNICFCMDLLLVRFCWLTEKHFACFIFLNLWQAREVGFTHQLTGLQECGLLLEQHVDLHTCMKRKEEVPANLYMGTSNLRMFYSIGTWRPVSLTLALHSFWALWLQLQGLVATELLKSRTLVKLLRNPMSIALEWYVFFLWRTYLLNIFFCFMSGGFWLFRLLIFEMLCQDVCTCTMVVFWLITECVLVTGYFEWSCCWSC